MRLNMSRSVLCLVPGPSRAKRVADDLCASGFSRDDISVVIPDRLGAREFAFDWVVEVNALALPGMGAFLARGPLFILFQTTATQGTSGVCRTLQGLGLSAFDANQLEIKLKAGSSLVAVHVDDTNDGGNAKEFCERHRAEHVYIGEAQNAKSAQ